METLRDFIIVYNTAVVHEKISASEYYLPVDSLQILDAKRFWLFSQIFLV
jgi:hypothetical protein